MSASRRLRLIEWAQRSGAWIIEDDYDSEYRYESQPISSLQGLDPNSRVIYIGTFSKVLFPALRLGYIVVPPDLVDRFVTTRRVMDLGSPSFHQEVLADFIQEGHFERHIRRMRAIYRSRRQLLLGLLRRELGGLVEVEAPDAGMNLVVWLPKGAEDAKVSAELAAAQVDAMPLSAWRIQRHLPPGLLLGYSGVREADLREGVRRLRAVLERLFHSSGKA